MTWGDIFFYGTSAQYLAAALFYFYERNPHYGIALACWAVANVALIHAQHLP